MLGLGKINCVNITLKIGGVKYYGATCCPPPRKPSGCAPGKSIGKCIPPPSKCNPCKPPIAPNPCVPRFPHGQDTWKKYRFLSIFVCIPLIAVQALYALTREHPHKEPCRDYEYMRIRTKKFPWGDESFFHNEHVNHLPGECEVPPPPSESCD